MDVNNLYPDYLTNQNFFCFLAQMLFVGMIFLGQYCFFRNDEDGIPKAFLYFPFCLFFFGFLSYLVGMGNLFYLLVQVGLISYAGYHLIKGNIRIPAVGGLEACIYGFLFLMAYFAWMVPIPESFNGHGHFIFNGLLRLIETDSVYFPNRMWLAYDNAIFAWPQHLLFVLRLYSLDHSAVFYRSAFLVPVLGCFVTIQVIKSICRQYQFSKMTGLLAFLAVIGTYYNSLNLFEIQYDMFSLLMLLFFLLVLGQARNERSFLIVDAGVLLLMAFLIRKQVFIILFFSLVIYLLTNFKTFRRIKYKSIVWLCLGFLSFTIWSVAAYYKYGSPIYTQDTSLTKKMFEKTIFTFDPQRHIEDIPLIPSAEASSTGAKGYGERIGALVDFGQRYFPSVDIEKLLFKFKGVALFVMRAGPLSLTVFIVFLIWWAVKRYPQYRPLIQLIFIIGGGCAVAYFVFFKGYRKFPQYLSVLTCIPAGIVLGQIQQKFKPLPYIMLGWCVFIFYVALFGHRNPGLNADTGRILAGRAGFIQKISYKANRSESELVRQSRELAEAYDRGGRLLQMDHEPGALLPSLMGQEYLAESPYFKTYRSKNIIVADTSEKLWDAFREMNIKHVLIPQRSMDVMDRHPLVICLNKIRKQRQYVLVVPVEEVVSSIEY